jgi:hypothetical protein
MKSPFLTLSEVISALLLPTESGSNPAVWWIRNLSEKLGPTLEAILYPGPRPNKKPFKCTFLNKVIVQESIQKIQMISDELLHENIAITTFRAKMSWSGPEIRNDTIPHWENTWGGGDFNFYILFRPACVVDKSLSENC